MIPKILHQTAPQDKSVWHPLWKRCQASWLENFSDFQYRLWNDNEIDELIQTEYPEFWDMYQEFPVHIMKIDFVRFAFMHKFGGIYADMDYYCYQNFHNDLTDTGYIVENPYGNDPIENSLMASQPGNIFFYKCMKEAQKRFENIKKNHTQLLNNIKLISLDLKYALKLRPMIIFYISGTTLISDMYRQNRNTISTLPGHLYNNHDCSYDVKYKARHTHTGLWGKENIEVISQTGGYHRHLRNIPLEQYDFYTDYSNGKYLKEHRLNIEKNDAFSTLKLETKFYYG